MISGLPSTAKSSRRTVIPQMRQSAGSPRSRSSTAERKPSTAADTGPSRDRSTAKATRSSARAGWVTGRVKVGAISFPASRSRPRKAETMAVSREPERERTKTAPTIRTMTPIPQVTACTRAAAGSVSAREAMPRAQNSRDKASTSRSMEKARASTVQHRNMTQGTPAASIYSR